MSTIISAAPVELHQATGWRPFLDRPSQTFYGWCVDLADDDAGCGSPWVLHLPTGRLVQCGCPDFTVDPNSIESIGAAEANSIRSALDRLDLTPNPRPTAWRYFEPCGSIGSGCGYRGGWWIEAITRSVIGCHCGWSPLDLHPWEVGQ